jgi:hypothetical protein
MDYIDPSVLARSLECFVFGWLTPWGGHRTINPPNGDNMPNKAPTCFVNSHFDIVEVKITMGARKISGRCHGVANSKRLITHVTMVKHGQALPVYDAPIHKGRPPSAFARAHLTQPILPIC